MSGSSELLDVILLYRVREGALLGGGSYMVRLPSGRLQTAEAQGPAIASPGQVYYGTDPAVAVHRPGSCPSCDAFTFCDCAEETAEDLDEARGAAEDLADVIAEILRLHPTVCEPETGRVICETCRQLCPCTTVSAVRNGSEAAARLIWEGARTWPCETAEAALNALEEWKEEP